MLRLSVVVDLCMSNRLDLILCCLPFRAGRWEASSLLLRAGATFINNH
jgi:hypothetical protein